MGAGGEGAAQCVVAAASPAAPLPARPGCAWPAARRRVHPPAPLRLPAPQITHRISWEEPVLPQRIAIDDEGGYIVTEAGGWVARQGGHA